MQNEQTRREFIVNSSKAFVTIIGVVTFSKYASFSQISKKENAISESLPYKGDYKDKILIAYESKFGSTREIAKFIGANLANNTRAIEIKKIDEVNDLSSYNKVIIGSAIQYDKWMPEARDFIVKNEDELATKSVSFFLVCLVLSKKTQKASLKANSYANEIKNLTPKIKIDDFGKFAGVLDYSKMSFGQRAFAKVIFAIIGVKEGNYIDWEMIKKWTKKLG